MKDVSPLSTILTLHLAVSSAVHIQLISILFTSLFIPKLYPERCPSTNYHLKYLYLLCRVLYMIRLIVIFF